MPREMEKQEETKLPAQLQRAAPSGSVPGPGIASVATAFSPKTEPSIDTAQPSFCIGRSIFVQTEPSASHPCKQTTPIVEYANIHTKYDGKKRHRNPAP